MSGFRRSSPVEISVGAANGMVYIYVPYLPGIPDKLKSIGARFSKYATVYTPDGKSIPNLPGRPAWILPKKVAGTEKKVLNSIPNFPSEQLEAALKYLEEETAPSPPVERKKVISLDDIVTDSEDESTDTTVKQATVSILGSKVKINVKPSTPLECYDTPYGPMVKVNGSWKLLTYGAVPHTVSLD